MKKCICKKCEDCRLYVLWDMENKDGLRKQINRCIFMVIADEIPKIRGSVDGCQQAANETQNKVIAFGQAAVETLKNVPKLLK